MPTMVGMNRKAGSKCPMNRRTCSEKNPHMIITVMVMQAR
jgi:hypothetical protein